MFTYYTRKEYRVQITRSEDLGSTRGWRLGFGGPPK